jgi:nucleoside diphosphate kinase
MIACEDQEVVHYKNRHAVEVMKIEGARVASENRGVGGSEESGETSPGHVGGGFGERKGATVESSW